MLNISYVKNLLWYITRYNAWYDTEPKWDPIWFMSWQLCVARKTTSIWRFLCYCCSHNCWLGAIRNSSVITLLSKVYLNPYIEASLVVEWCFATSFRLLGCCSLNSFSYRDVHQYTLDWEFLLFRPEVFFVGLILRLGLYYSQLFIETRELFCLVRVTLNCLGELKQLVKIQTLLCETRCECLLLDVHYECLFKLLALHVLTHVTSWPWPSPKFFHQSLVRSLRLRGNAEEVWQLASENLKVFLRYRQGPSSD